MEFPELGSHCTQSDCNQLDFLPVKCDACGNKYCSVHWQYQAHSCPKSHLRNVQVPVCPLCDQPVPSTRGVVPDIAVSAHIDRDCKSDPAVRKRIYTNRCSMSKCKQKELVKIFCDDCRLNFCLKHRHPTDHKCTGKPSSSQGALSKAGQAALARFQPAAQRQPQKQAAKAATARPPPSTSAFQGGLSEDEALRRALEASMRDQGPASGSVSGLSQEEQDRMLAEAIERSEREATSQQPQQQGSTSTGDSKNCQIS